MAFSTKHLHKSIFFILYSIFFLNLYPITSSVSNFHFFFEKIILDGFEVQGWIPKLVKMSIFPYFYVKLGQAVLKCTTGQGFNMVVREGAKKPRISSFLGWVQSI